VTIEQAIQIALASHQAGRLDEAERIYQQVLQAQPVHPDALHLLGLIACQGGRDDVGAPSCAIPPPPNTTTTTASR
jgi:hypothetical protein